MNHFKIGSNFDEHLIERIKEINDSSEKNIIDEVYGSRRESEKFTARPGFRLPDIDRKRFCDYVSELKKIGVSFNYTLNTSSLGSKVNIQENEQEILEYINFLSNVGVDTITVALPIVAEYVRTIDKHIGLEVSTIAHIDTITQVAIWKERYNISKICGNLHKNREIRFLKNLTSYCKNNDIILTLMVNEFCGNGLVNGTGVSNCIYRDHCYNLHSMGYNKEDKINCDYPMGRCIQSRSNDIEWMKLNFIRPEDLKLYNSIGIDHFKITGRTGSTSYISKIVKAYFEEQFSGNLLELWKHLETIEDRKDDSTFTPEYYIENSCLDGFLLHWFENEQHICANEECGVSCMYCDNFFYKNVLKKG